MAQRKQLQILKTAEILFNKFGIKKTAVDDIARNARVAKATIYNYFRNKDGLLKALVVNKIQQFESKLLDLNESTNPIEAIKLLIQEHIKFFMDNPFFNDILTRENELNDVLNKKEEHFLRKIIHQAQNKGLLTDTDSNQLLTTLLLLLKGIESRIKVTVAASIDSFDDNIDFISKAFFKTKSLNGGNNGTA